jgi:hypothetical protein
MEQQTTRHAADNTPRGRQHATRQTTRNAKRASTTEKWLIGLASWNMCPVAKFGPFTFSSM